MNSIPLKTCSDCKQAFPATKEFFHTRNASADKLSLICKECNKLKSRIWHDANKAHANTGRRNRYNKKWETQERKQKARVQAKEGFKYCYDCETEKPATNEFFHANKSSKDGLYTYCKECTNRRIQLIHAKAPEKNTDRVRKWREDNPEEYKVQNKVIKARRRAAGQMPTKDVLEELYEQSEDHCMYCGIRLFGEYHLEHMNPIVRGGSNEIENLAVVCADCNLNKGDKTFTEWVAVRGW